MTITVDLDELAESLDLSTKKLKDELLALAMNRVISEASRLAQSEWFEADKARRPTIPPEGFEERHLIAAAREMLT